MSGLNCNRF